MKYLKKSILFMMVIFPVIWYSQTICHYNAYDCWDFECREYAESTYRECQRLGYWDIHRLDDDKDWEICEWSSYCHDYWPPPEREYNHEICDEFWRCVDVDTSKKNDVWLWGNLLAILWILLVFSPFLYWIFIGNKK